MSAPSLPSIFRWNTLREVARHDFLVESGLFPGKECEVELTSGQVILVWRTMTACPIFVTVSRSAARTHRAGRYLPTQEGPWR